MDVKQKRILYVANVDWFFISHRLVLAEESIKNGYDVTVACKDTGRKCEIEEIGAKFVDFKFERSGTNPLNELLTIFGFLKLYKKVNPDLVHHITLKPIIYGSIVSRILKIPTVNAVSGLGFNFTEEKKGFTTKIMIEMMKFGFRNKQLVVIFQNKDDKLTVEKRGIIDDLTKTVRIKGAGVDLKFFSFSPPQKKEIIEIILPARLLWDKGVKEFYEAASILKEKYYGRVVFKLIGVADTDNKAGVTEMQLQKWVTANYFLRVDYQTKMFPIYVNSDIVVLPSYREGMPKTLLEACAVGRPIVTTDAIGCRECVDEGINGFKVPVRDSATLAQKLSQLIDNEEIRLKMGTASRVKAETEFDVRNVIEIHLRLYKELTNIK